MAASVSPARNNGHNTAIHFSRGVNSQLTAPPFPPSLRLTSQFNQVSKQNLCFQTEQLMRNRFTNFKEMHWNFFSEFTTHIAWNSKIKVGLCTIKKRARLSMKYVWSLEFLWNLLPMKPPHGFDWCNGDEKMNPV